MVDVHCHILPGLDDGAADEKNPWQWRNPRFRMAITHVVATPHSSAEFRFDYERVRELHGQLQRLVGDRLVLATGCDFHLNLENLEALRKDPARFCINQRNYLLVEFSEFSIPPTTSHTLHDMQLMGLHPIITHPERNAIIQAQTKLLASWVRLGCFVQVTGGSLTGTFGPRAKADASALDRDWAWCISWPATRTIRGDGRCGCSPRMRSSGNNLAISRPGRCFSTIPWRRSKGASCLTCPKLLRSGKPGQKRKRFWFF